MWKKFGYKDIIYYPADYNSPPPDVLDKDVYLVDFSYKKDIMIEMSKVSRQIIILDHHKTSQLNLKDLDFYIHPESKHKSPMRIYFDMNRSGCGITWDYFFPNIERNKLINYIEDRDLWKFRLPYTKEIIMALRSYPMEFEIWDNLDINRLQKEGTIIKRFYDQKVQDIMKHKFEDTISGFKVGVINTPEFMCSEVANKLAEQYPFGVTYYDSPNGRIYSLRSTKKGEDVSKIAEQFGGGGHKHSAGFKKPNLKNQ